MAQNKNKTGWMVVTFIYLFCVTSAWSAEKGKDASLLVEQAYKECLRNGDAKECGGKLEEKNSKETLQHSIKTLPGDVEQFRFNPSHKIIALESAEGAHKHPRRLSESINLERSDQKPNVTDKHENALGHEERIASEKKGDFPSMQRHSSAPLGTLQTAWDKPKKTMGQVAPGIVRYSWTPHFVMPLRLRDYMTTSVQFPTWEKITSFYVGDPYVFSVQQAEGNVLILRSLQAGADSNFTALGSSGHMYNFYLRSEQWNSKHISDMAVYVDAAPPSSFWGTSTANQTAAPAQSSIAMTPITLPGQGNVQVPDYVRSIMFRPENMQFDLELFARTKEDEAIAPERVWHDGVFTYFDYGSKADAVQRPVIFLVVDKVDTMVNSRSAGPNNNILIAEAVGDFTLRNGKKVVCVKRKREKVSFPPDPQPQ